MTLNYKELQSDKIEFLAVAEESELPNGERLFVEIDEFNIVIFNIAGQLFAIGDVCSHDNGPVGEGELEDHAVVCPRHGARFDVKTGRALTLPAVLPVKSYPVQVAGDEIRVEVA